MTRERGVSLLELMIVVIVLGVLAAVGIPSYQRTLERSYWKEANDILMTIYHGERSYYLTHNAYQINLFDLSPMDEWRKIHIDNPNLGSVPIDFSVDTVGCAEPCFVARAQRERGPCVGRQLTIDHNRTIGGNWPEDGSC